MFKFLKKKKTNTKFALLSDFIGHLKKEIDVGKADKKDKDDLISDYKKSYEEFVINIENKLDSKINSRLSFNLYEYNLTATICFNIDTSIDYVKPQQILDLLGIIITEIYGGCCQEDTSFSHLCGHDNVSLSYNFEKKVLNVWFIKGKETLTEDNANKICQLFNEFEKQINELRQYTKK